MFTKPKNAYSLTHTIIWDILYCYSGSIQASFNRYQIHRIVRKLLTLLPGPRGGPMIPRPIERYYVVNIYFSGVLNHFTCERANPPPRYHPASISRREPDGGRRR